MEEWAQAIYDATGIPLKESELVLAFRGRQWWLMYHRHPVLLVGSDSDSLEAVTPTVRADLIRVMEQRLSESIPVVQRLIEALDAERVQLEGAREDLNSRAAEVATRARKVRSEAAQHRAALCPLGHDLTPHPCTSSALVCDGTCGNKKLEVGAQIFSVRSLVI